MITKIQPKHPSRAVFLSVEEVKCIYYYTLVLCSEMSFKNTQHLQRGVMDVMTLKGTSQIQPLFYKTHNTGKPFSSDSYQWKNMLITFNILHGADL